MKKKENNNIYSGLFPTQNIIDVLNREIFEN